MSEMRFQGILGDFNDVTLFVSDAYLVAYPNFSQVIGTQAQRSICHKDDDRRSDG